MKLFLLLILFLFCLFSNALFPSSIHINYKKLQSFQRNQQNEQNNQEISSNLRKPRIIKPSNGYINKNDKQIPNLNDKFLMMYTCNICKGRVAQMISKIAYQQGMVISTCTHCKNKHLIADNEGKLDFPSFGKKIEDFLQAKGENIQKLSLTSKDLEENYLLDQDGVISIVSKMAGQPPSDATIVEIPQTEI